MATSMEMDRDNIVTKFNSVVKNKSKSAKIEDSIYRYSLGKAKEYKWGTTWDNDKFRRIYLNKCLCLYCNLDKNNSVGNKNFLKRVKGGEIDLDKIAFMTPQQLFPEKWKKLLDRKKASDNFLYCKQLAPVTDKYICGKCKKNKCTSYEVQIRSSDEPMSTMVECLECGYSWQF
jgi:DNA-directed RNA polymerase subunit M/transcription elongation factor TFIIS